MTIYQQQCAIAVSIVRRACWISKKIQNSFDSIDSISKLDTSPVTVADFAVQAVILSRLHAEFPHDRFIAEETSTLLREQEAVARQVTEAVNEALRWKNPMEQGRNGHIDDTKDIIQDFDSMSPEQVMEAIDLGNDQGGKGWRTWVLDPIDGTKGFVRKQQYCIGLALLENGIPQIGILGCPNLPATISQVGTLTPGSLFYAIRGTSRVFRETALPVDTPPSVCTEEITCRHSSVDQDLSWTTYMESVESAHSDHKLSVKVAQELGIQETPIRMDSMCKYGVLASGQASIFMRFPKNEYVENIWDHAAGVVVLEEAGGRVTDGTGRSLDFSLGRKLNNDKGIVATSGVSHDVLIEAIKKVL